MHFCYGLANGVSTAACQLYQVKFPRRQLPNHQTIAAIHRRSRENGKFSSTILVEYGRHPTISENFIDEILQRTQNNPELFFFIHKKSS